MICWSEAYQFRTINSIQKFRVDQIYGYETTIQNNEQAFRYEEPVNKFIKHSVAIG